MKSFFIKAPSFALLMAVWFAPGHGLAQPSHALRVFVKQDYSVTLNPGIVVDEVPQGSFLEYLGFRKGDILLQWSQGNDRGKFSSPFDTFNLMVERYPFGKITIDGYRGSQQRSWILVPRLGAEIVSRPNFGENTLPFFQNVLEGSKVDSFCQSLTLEGASRLAKQSNVRWLGSWI